MTWNRRKRPPEVRFWEHVDRTGECWVWTAATDRAGYGFFAVAPGRMRRAHRVAYEMANGPIPDGLVVMHRCDNPPCVRPEHLAVGTDGDNAHDAQRKGRNPRGDTHGRRRISAAIAREIRKSAAAGARQVDIAAAHHVSEATVSRVVRGIIWKGDPK